MKLQLAAVVLAALSANALSLPDFSKLRRHLMDTSTTAVATEPECDVPDFEDTSGKGCTWLADCTACGDAKCIAVYETASLDTAMEDSMDMWTNHTMGCFLVAAAATSGSLTAFANMDMDMRRKLQAESTTTATGCPTEAEIDAIEGDWAIINAMTSESGVVLDSAAAAKTFVSENCAGASADAADVMDMAGATCISKDMAPFMEAQTGACAGMMEDDDVCNSNPYITDDACWTAMGGAMGISSGTLSSMKSTAEALHDECQAQATEAACDAFDGSEWVTSLNETTVTSGTQAQAVMVLSAAAAALLAMLLA